MSGLHQRRIVDRKRIDDYLVSGCVPTSALSISCRRGAGTSPIYTLEGSIVGKEREECRRDHRAKIYTQHLSAGMAIVNQCDDVKHHSEQAYQREPLDAGQTRTRQCQPSQASAACLEICGNIIAETGEEPGMTASCDRSAIRLT